MTGSGLNPPIDNAAEEHRGRCRDFAEVSKWMEERCWTFSGKEEASPPAPRDHDQAPSSLRA